MENYERHTHAVDTLYKELNRLIGTGVLADKKVIMFGTSNLASIIIYYLHINGIEVQAIIDNDASRQGKIVYGVQVYKPESYLKPFDERSRILIASTYQEEMAVQLEALGYKRGIHILYAIDLPKEMNDYSFADRTGYIEMSPEDIKKCQLGILRKLHEVCTKYGIRYYICGGTLLGAVRHKGYIPWDDDVDVVMPMPDIIRLSKILAADEDYSLISFAGDYEYFDICSLLVDNHTLCDFNGFMQLTSGVSIDVFPFIGVPEEESAREQYLQRIRELEMQKWNLLYDPIACKEANQKLVDYMLSFDYDSHKTIGNVLGRYFTKDIFPRAYFDETVLMPFEGLQLVAPKGWDAYLSGLYGDYMKLPPVEKRVGVHYYKAYYERS